MNAMTIGKLAKSAGVNVETIRYYQRLSLLEAPAKPPGGVLKELIGRCDRRRGKVACPIIETLARR